MSHQVTFDTSHMDFKQERNNLDIGLYIKHSSCRPWMMRNLKAEMKSDIQHQ